MQARLGRVPTDDAVEDAKQAWRNRVWAAMSETHVARFPGARGRIPNFTGAERAADRLADLAVWKRATALKSNPDLPQLPVRAAALAAGKLVVMAVPRLRTAEPFLLLDPAVLEVPPGSCGTTWTPRRSRLSRRWPSASQGDHRSKRKNDRTSSTKSSGCSKAAKCPPLSSSFQ